MHWSKRGAIVQQEQYRYRVVANMANEEESLRYSHFPDSGGPPDFVLPGNVESTLLSKIVYRGSFPEFKRKSQAFKLNLSLIRTRQSLPQPGKEKRMILVETFVIRVRVGVGISLIMGC